MKIRLILGITMLFMSMTYGGVCKENPPEELPKYYELEVVYEYYTMEKVPYKEYNPKTKRHDKDSYRDEYKRKEKVFNVKIPVNYSFKGEIVKGDKTTCLYYSNMRLSKVEYKKKAYEDVRDILARLKMSSERGDLVEKLIKLDGYLSLVPNPPLKVEDITKEIQKYFEGVPNRESCENRFSPYSCSAPYLELNFKSSTPRYIKKPNISDYINGLNLVFLKMIHPEKTEKQLREEDKALKYTVFKIEGFLAHLKYERGYYQDTYYEGNLSANRIDYSVLATTNPELYEKYKDEGDMWHLLYSDGLEIPVIEKFLSKEIKFKFIDNRSWLEHSLDIDLTEEVYNSFEFFKKLYEEVTKEQVNSTKGGSNE